MGIKPGTKPRYTGVYKRPSGSWQYKLTHDGHVVTRGGYDSAADAYEARNTMKESLRAGDEIVTASRMTLHRFVEDVWFPSLQDDIVQGHRQSSTVKQMMSVTNAYIIPKFGSIPLNKLSTDAVREWLTWLPENGSAARTLKINTVRQAYSSLKLLLDYAVDRDLIAKNPVLRVRRPRRQRTPMRTWTENQVRIFFTGIKDHHLFPVFVMLFTTGMRRGEIAGLRWDAVNLPQRQLSVERQRTTNGTSDVVDKEILKSRSAHRRIDLDVALVAVLQRLQTEQDQRRRKDPSYNPLGYVFVTHDGNPYHPQSLRKSLRSLAEDLKLPPLRFHEGRHTAASLLLERGTHLKIVQELLGHSSVAVTADVYSHVTPTMHRDAVALLGAMIPETETDDGDELARRRRRSS